MEVSRGPSLRIGNLLSSKLKAEFSVLAGSVVRPQPKREAQFNLNTVHGRLLAPEVLFAATQGLKPGAPLLLWHLAQAQKAHGHLA